MPRLRATFAATKHDEPLKRLDALLRKHQGSHVKVGVLGSKSKKRRDGIDTVMLAAIHEFGTRTIPERSFIRSTYEKNKDAYKASLASMVRAIVEGRPMTLPRALGLLGARMSADMKMTIKNRIPPPLQPETIRRKGSDVPLIDTGQLINSITWAVIAKGEK